MKKYEENYEIPLSDLLEKNLTLPYYQRYEFFWLGISLDFNIF